MRSSAEMDLLDEGFPLEVVSLWLGHSPTVARRHYIRPHQEHFDLASKKRSKKRSTIRRITDTVSDISDGFKLIRDITDHLETKMSTP